MTPIRLLLACAGVAALALSSPGRAAGPDNVARLDRSLWPEPLQGPAAFDRASRGEILVAVGALREFFDMDAAALAGRLHLKEADEASVRRIAGKFSLLLLNNYRQAAASCPAGEWLCPRVAGEADLLAAGRALADGMPAQFRAWFDASSQFHRVYMAEEMRLAALFPRTSSEIDTYSDIERTGFELPDRHFLLTFDDGPTAKDGLSDQLLALLRDNRLHGAFFMLGERLEPRRRQSGEAALASLYEGQCVAAHGWQHQSHQRWAEWQSSVVTTRDLAKETFPGAYRAWFRPPYGQRLSDSGPFFTQNGLKIVLWNIDSQDWNNGMSAGDVAQRVQTLMLLWRRGTILMHDIHAKAKSAVPWLIDQNRGDGVEWEDCRTY